LINAFNTLVYPVMKAVFLDYQTVSNADLDPGPLRAVLPELVLYDQSDEAQIRQRMADAEAVLLNKVNITGSIIESSPRLKIIALAATGSNNVDVAAARERGVAVCNIRGYCTASVTQHVWGTILSLTHHLREYSTLATDGSWAGNAQFTMLSHPIRELRGRILGIVGYGELGKGVAAVGESFGMRVLVANRHRGEPAPGRMDLHALLRVADIVSLHCPLTEATRGMIGVAELATMKPDALLINTARGALIDGAALAAALRARRLGGAGIDVLSREPPVDGDPLLDQGIPNLIVTPHIAWAAQEARQRCLAEMAENIRDFLHGGRRGRVV
jgi:glycerate dehydrogenase